MAGNDHYELHLVKVDTTVLSEIRSSSFSPNGNVQRLRAMGSIDPSATVFLGQSPLIRFSTLMIDTALDNIGIDGDDVSTGLELGFVEKAQGGSLEATGEKVAAAKCLIVPASLSAEQDGLAEIAYDCYCYSSDGATAPLDHTASLPLGTPVANEYFTTGTISVNGSALSQVVGWRLEFGINVEVHKADGLLYPTKVNLVGPRAPVLEVTCANLGHVTDALLVGAEVDNVVMNLKKLSTTGGGLAGSGDKTLTMAKAFQDFAEVGGAFPGEPQVRFRFQARYDGVNAIIAIT